MNPEALPDIASYAAPIYVGLIVLEIVAIARLHGRGEYETRDTATSLLMGTGNLVFKVLLASSVLGGIAALFALTYQHRLFEIGFSPLAFIVCFILDDLSYYWAHRSQHEIRWGWASHVVHHSSQHYNLSTALRQPWFGFLSGYFLFSLPLIFLGFHPAMVAFVSSLNLFYQFFIHTEVVGRLPAPIEWLFNTPSHHRVHHGKNPRYLDANYGGVLIIWDRLFGTFVAEDDAEPVRYGLVRDIGTFNPFRVAVHEYVAIAQDIGRKGLSLGARLGYLLGRPGWSHDGSRRTSRDIKRAAGLLPRRD